MRVITLPNIMKFEGILDENTALTDLETAFQKVKAQNTGQPIVLDLSKVSRANSSGILVWLRFLKSANTSFKYINVPVWLVNQFNMISGHFEGGSFVESFQAPFFSPKTQASKSLILTVGKDVPLQKDYAQFSLPLRVVDGIEYEIDFDPVQFFHFLSENSEGFSKAKL